MIWLIKTLMDLSVDAAAGVARHCNLLADALPRISDALPWPTDPLRLQMTLE